MGLSTNLTAYWSLEEASGTRVDATGRGNDLTAINAPGNTTGKIGNAVSVNNQYLERADNTDLSTGDIDFAIAAWCNLAALQNATIMSRYQLNGNQREYVLFYNQNDHVTNNRFSLIVSSNGTATTTLDATSFGAASTSTWYFVMGWHDSVNNVIGISVNDVSNTASYSSGVFDSTAPFDIGRLLNNTTPVYTFNGSIDEAAFWKNYVPNSTERTWLFNSGAARSYTEVAAYESSGAFRRQTLTGGMQDIRGGMRG